MARAVLYQYRTEDEIEFMRELKQKGKYALLHKYCRMVLADTRWWDKTVDVGSVKAYASATLQQLEDVAEEGAAA